MVLWVPFDCCRIELVTVGEDRTVSLTLCTAGMLVMGPWSSECSTCCSVVMCVHCDLVAAVAAVGSICE